MVNLNINHSILQLCKTSEVNPWTLLSCDRLDNITVLSFIWSDLLVLSCLLIYCIFLADCRTLAPFQSQTDASPDTGSSNTYPCKLIKMSIYKIGMNLKQSIPVIWLVQWCVLNYLYSTNWPLFYVLLEYRCKMNFVVTKYTKIIEIN